MKKIGAAVFGSSSEDAYVNASTVERTSESIKITLRDASVHTFPAKPTESKLTVTTIPREFDCHVEREQGGGGGVNSHLAIGSIATELRSDEEIRYLDANQFSSLIQSQFPSTVRRLELRPVPRNYVFGMQADKCILRSPIGSAVDIGPQQFANIDWCCEAGTLLLNGPKDEEPVEAIFDRRSRGGFKVIFVVTPALRAEFLRRMVPSADVLIGAWDELPFLTGQVAVTMDGAERTAGRLRELAPRTEIHVTMGKHGVLSMAPGSNEMVHVRLDPASGIFGDVQNIVRVQPTNLCGAGDAFAGGVLGLHAFGWSLISGGQAAGSHVRAALAGCASSLRWVGYASAVPAGVFLIGPAPGRSGQEWGGACRVVTAFSKP